MRKNKINLPDPLEVINNIVVSVLSFLSKSKLGSSWKKFLEWLVDTEVYRGAYTVRSPLDSVGKRTTVMKDSLFLHFWPVKTHRNDLRISYHLGMGLATTWLFVILTITGVLLMFYYRPSVPQAYYDMVDIREGVYPFGMFLRNMHRWAAHGMGLFTIIHMWRVFNTGSYKPPRQLNWILGVILLVLTLLLSFTGYLLPWDQLSLWAITVGQQMGANAPILGHLGPFAQVTNLQDAAFGLVGGTEIGPAGLIRFYVLHVFFLPFVTTILIAYHFWRVRKDGYSFPQT